VRDLLVVLGHDRATFVGHSLGGGIAMQAAYQFPEMCERLVLTCSGGLGKEVNPLLRIISAPGSEYVLPVVLTPRVHRVAESVGRFIGKAGLRGDPFWGEVWASYTRLTDARTQRAFVHTIRAVIDVAGQRVSARDRLYLAKEVPTLILWGDRDGVIPVAHAYAAHELMPGSRLEIIEGAGHFVPIEQPAVITALLVDFLATTKPAQVLPSEWQAALTSA
jgi:pimeloyl-ACP methyl ester carboxylesterase